MYAATWLFLSGCTRVVAIGFACPFRCGCTSPLQQLLIMKGFWEEMISLYLSTFYCCHLMSFVGHSTVGFFVSSLMGVITVKQPV